jgi:hypothetical protein
LSFRGRRGLEPRHVASEARRIRRRTLVVAPPQQNTMAPSPLLDDHISGRYLSYTL